LLTNKKPEKATPQQGAGTALATLPSRTRAKGGKGETHGEGEAEALRQREPGEEEVVWQLGEDSDEEDGGQTREQEEGKVRRRSGSVPHGEGSHGPGPGEERRGLMREDEDGEDENSESTRVAKDDEEFGDWNDGDRKR